MLWEDLDAATKEARGLTKADAGVDVTDGATTLVQCKLRARYLTWRECATFFASAVSFTDGAYHVPWQSLLLARNACCKLSRPLAELGASRPFDLLGKGKKVFKVYRVGLRNTAPKTRLTRRIPKTHRSK